jgi:hypothetical protein
MEALAIYQGVLRELDRFGSPRYDVNDHNYFVNVVKDEVVDALVQLYEQTQEITEMLSGIIDAYDIPVGSNERRAIKIIDLKPSFDNMKGVVVRFRYVKNYECHQKGDTKELPARRMTTDAEGFAMTNNYYKPSFERENVFYRTREKKVEILYDRPENVQDYVVIENLRVEHTLHPPDIILGQDGTNVANSTLHRKVNRKIIVGTAAKFLENSKSQRTQTFNKLNN